MRKIYTLIMAAMSSLMAFAGDVVPNGGMDNWDDCTPWTSSGNTKTKGTTPDAWTISHVIGINGTGATAVGKSVEGYNGGTAANIYNSPNSLLSSQIVPGYMSLGTTWSTSVLGSKNDGGTFGGVNWTSRPDAVSFMYKRSHGTANADEAATVIAYLWKGTWSQDKVPADIKMFGSATTCTMVNRDRNILGIETPFGGNVTKTDDAELVASVNTTITGDADDWTMFVAPLEYKSTAAPEMMNIILCAGDYFSTSPGKDNSLTVDDVRYVYYSRLDDIAINGVTIAGFDSDVYDYTVDMSMTDIIANQDNLTFTALGQSGMAVASISFDEVNATATITCTNAAGTDIDDKNTYEYVLHFKSEQGSEVESVKYTGTLSIDLGPALGGDKVEMVTDLYIEYVSEGICNIKLLNLVLDAGDGATMEIGDIIATNVAVTEVNGTKTYTGKIEGLKLLEGMIEADADVTGNENANGELKLMIDVLWNNLPIPVVFNGDIATAINKVVTDDADAPTGCYDLRGIRHSGECLAPGLYIINGKKVLKK